MYNPEFKYYQHVDQAGRLMSLVSDVLHTALNEIHTHFKNQLLEVKTDQCEKHDALNDLKKVIKQFKITQRTNILKRLHLLRIYLNK